MQIMDEFGIGQVRLRRIARDEAVREMGECAPVAFWTGYVPDMVRDMMRRRFYAARAVYEQVTHD